MLDLKFIYLCIYSDFFMVDGLFKVLLLVKKVVVMGMFVMVLIDFINLCGLVKFYSIVYNCGVKLIIGVDFIL